ncbi:MULTISPECIES: nucleotidyltransferase domain-containing protein [unclassified Pseudovibrio]|uniref:nucleotidyltransferase domain-containing protein n=1 Tax=unclassified Pseudovibrio TaxID=2627060 RepID=UPI0007AE3AA3|nr:MULTISPECIES: nucleotidyltransferase domain-containing protein [unclassified Pseudovibrio]KZK92438.1 Nucleotidyltransferase domain protein [Pseudovibrio sp. W74]KZL06204.1 Nucleotidyltransferase domain protein [Pseudovibrio sp. Ad14]
MEFPSSALSQHRSFISQAILKFKSDKRIVGLACSGSYSDNTLDEYSDLDFVVAVDPLHYEEVFTKRFEMIAELGDLVSAFSGDHVGEPRLVIALYGPDGLHIDFKFAKANDISDRVDEPTILWERTGQLSEALAKGHGAYPRLDEQWVEDRFWTWMHYCAGKICRGEYFEALDFLSFIRVQVLGPLALQQAGYEPRGVRKIEFVLPKFAMQLLSTVCQPEKGQLKLAAENAASIYLDMRSSEVSTQDRAKQIALSALQKI